MLRYLAQREAGQVEGFVEARVRLAFVRDELSEQHRQIEELLRGEVIAERVLQQEMVDFATEAETRHENIGDHAGRLAVADRFGAGRAQHRAGRGGGRALLA